MKIFSSTALVCFSTSTIRMICIILNTLRPQKLGILELQELVAFRDYGIKSMIYRYMPTTHNRNSA